MIGPEWGTVLAGVIIAGIAALATWGSAKIQHKAKPEHAMIDQLQEEMEKMRLRMDRFEARDRVYIPHILRLNHHIESGLGPPAPAIPKVIIDFLNAEHEE